MKHSFIAPRLKRLISTELRMVLFFFTVTIVMLVGTYSFLLYKTYDFIQERAAITDKMVVLEDATKKIEADIIHIDGEVKISDQVMTDNTVMKESIRNLFDLVPDTITLSRAELDEKSLVLYGMTPNKETYEYILHAPLRSIFNRTYSSFYPIENGWYRFVSTNYLDDDDNETEVVE